MLTTSVCRVGWSTRTAAPLVGRSQSRGSALLMVLWLTAALSAIAFSLAGTVRSELERTSSSVERLKANYLATGAVERALLYIEWSRIYRNPDGSPRYYTGPRITMDFPSGQAEVDVIPETSKLNINAAEPEELLRLFLASGLAPERARAIVLGILDWRTFQNPGVLTSFDQLYLSRNPSFQARHASFEEIEELLLVQGMTPELFYGTYERDEKGRLAYRAGLRDSLSVYGTAMQVDANTAGPEVLRAVGLAPDTVDAVVRFRSQRPFRDADELSAFGGNRPGFDRLRVGGVFMYTVRATARPRIAGGALSDARRSVAALVKFMDRRKFSEPFHVLRWYGNARME